MRVARADHPAVLVALGDRHLRAERLARLVEEPRQRDRVASARAARASRHPDRLRRAGDQVRVLVLLALALPDQVEQHPVRLAAAGDVRDHRRTPVSSPQLRDELVDLGERLLQPLALAHLPGDVRRPGRAG